MYLNQTFRFVDTETNNKETSESGLRRKCVCVCVCGEGKAAGRNSLWATFNHSLVCHRGVGLYVQYRSSGQCLNNMADISVAVGILATIGCVIIVWLLTDSLWNLFQGVKVHLLPYFQPTSVNLTKKFGPWAGKRNYYSSKCQLREYLE